MMADLGNQFLRSLVSKIEAHPISLMAHGGLSHTGKVKNRTPKVEKKERTHKRKTGRANMREKYNRLMQREASGSKDGPNKQRAGKMGMSA